VVCINIPSSGKNKPDHRIISGECVLPFRRMNLSVCLGVLTSFAGIAPVCAFEVNPTNTVPGVVANSLIANGDGGDWNSAELLIQLTAGEVYNDPTFDSMTPQQIFWGTIPDLEFDSWVGIPGDNTGSIFGSAIDLGDTGPAVIADQKVSVTWFNTDITNTGPVRIANISLTDNALGTWSVIAGFSGNVLLSESGWVLNGELVLTPPALPGDLDSDGFVGINDLNIVLGNWNQNVPPGDPLADPSGDNFVGIGDLNIVLGNWNAGTPPANSTVPEPASLVLLSAGVLARIHRRM
jgi:hypothetical protein